MSSFTIKLLMCFFIVFGSVEENKSDLIRHKRFISLLTDSVKIIASGIQQQSEILNQGIKNQKEIISQLPALVQETSQAVRDSVLQAASIPATVAANVLLNGANAYLKASKKETIALPEISTSVLGFGRFTAKGGKLKNLSTLISNGQVNLKKSGLTLTIEIPVRLGELSIEYDHYSFRTWGINLEGNVKATFGKNGFLIRLQLLGSADCSINLQRVEVQTLEDIKVDLQGSFSSFLKSATNYIATYLKDIIKAEIQKALDQYLSEFVNKNSKLICSRFTEINIG